MIPNYSVVSNMCLQLVLLEYRIQVFFGHNVFLKLVSGWLNDNQKTPVAVGWGSKNNRYLMLLGKHVCVSWKYFFVKYCRLISIFYIKYVWKKCCIFFGHPYRSNGSCPFSVYFSKKPKTNQIIVHFIFYLWTKIFLTYPFSRWDQLAKKRNQGYRTEYT